MGRNTGDLWRFGRSLLTHLQIHVFCVSSALVVGMKVAWHGIWGIFEHRAAGYDRVCDINGRGGLLRVVDTCRAQMKLGLA